MKNLFTLFILCFFSLKSYSRNDNKAASGENDPRLRITYGNMSIAAPYFADDFIAYVCEGLSRTFTVTTDGGATTFSWYRNDVLIVGATTNQLTVSTAGKYKAKASNSNNFSNTVTVVMAKKPAKPKLTFTE